MTLQWRYEASLSTLLLWLFLSSGVCVEQEVKKDSMYSSSLCGSGGKEVKWLSEKTSYIITGKNGGSTRKECKVVFGLASKAPNARLRINFDFIYFHDCGVSLQINESSASQFDQPSINKEMFHSGCYSENPGPLIAEPKHYVLLFLNKKFVNLNAYNFHLNISVAEKVPSTGPPMHVLIIVSFVCVVVVVSAAVIMCKYAIRRSYRWSEERTEQNMTRAINLYNSSEPLEEPEMVYIQPGTESSSSSTVSGQRIVRQKPAGPEIAFVHTDGRIERFRPLQGQRSEQPTAGAPLQRPKPQKCRVGSSPFCEGRQAPRVKTMTTETDNERDHYVLHYPRHRSAHNESQSLVDFPETASLGGIDLPPSYEEALEMPLPKDDEVILQEDVLNDSVDSSTGAVGGVNGCANRARSGDSGQGTKADNPPNRRKASKDVIKDHPLEHGQDLEELGRNSSNYMNIGGHLEILDHEAGDDVYTTSVGVCGSHHPCQDPLLPHSSPKNHMT